ncbi:MAG: di-heme oxidoredictase family protein [Hyphomicrobiaceae bacterium]|nr:di-heme oxidoredictase family protein [Hyphomicrobiaceae bacterium]
MRHGRRSPPNGSARLAAGAALAAGLVVAAGTLHQADGAGSAGPVRQRVADASELLPGGTATTRGSVDSRDAFSRASHGIGLSGEARFKLGNAVFRKLWVSAPASTKSSDGLGPLYNARGCQNCHLKDGRGRPPEPGESAVSMVVRLSVPPGTPQEIARLAAGDIAALPEPTYGGQLQTFAIQGFAAEGRVAITYVEEPFTFPDGTVVHLRRPHLSIADPAYGSLHPGAMLSARIAPPMIGLGLIEAIPEADIRARADPDDRDGDGISGRVAEVWDHGAKRLALGRFGWKAGQPTLRQQSADAFLNDMGLSTSLFPVAWGDCTTAQPACLAAPDGNSPGPGDPEVGDQLLDLVTFYAQNLAVPLRRGAETPEVVRGRDVFAATGCAACHVPGHVTGTVEGQPHLSGQRIWPYTDLLLHDMGDDLADGRPEGSASGREWRTPPLWGIGLTETVNGHTYFLHDGRARSVEEAILWHGGEAEAARDRYARLPRADRAALLAFVASL